MVPKVNFSRVTVVPVNDTPQERELAELLGPALQNIPKMKKGEGLAAIGKLFEALKGGNEVLLQRVYPVGKEVKSGGVAVLMLTIQPEKKPKKSKKKK